MSAVYPVSLNANEKRMIKLTSNECKELQMKNPRLWWPNGYGEQYLYDASLSLISSGKDTLDVKKMRIGIRELEYELSAYEDNSPIVRLNYNPTAALQDGKPAFDTVKRKKTDNKVRYTNYDGEFVPYLLKPVSSQGIELIKDSLMKEYMVIKVNGQRIFCKGGNWGMDDGMKRVSRERLEPALKLHKNMNYNMIRNWTGESTEEVFYELCDEYGMLVMNDFWLSTDGFNLNPLDNCLFVRNVTETVRRFRNHPSIALWCARNEGFATNELEYMLAATLAKEDGSRHYTGNSRSLNSSGSGPWRYQFDAGWYYRSLAGGFRSEVGTPSLPTAETVREFMAEEDTWPISDVWYYHDWHNHRYGSKTFSELYKEGMDRKLGPSDNLDDFCRKAQLINYESHRAIFEAWNSKMWNDASGVLLWMSHPAWPSMVWQNYSSNGETAGAYYGTQKACRPLHIQMSLNSQHKVDVINTTLKEYRNLKVEVVVYDKVGKKIRSSQQKVSHVTANALTPVAQLEDIKGLPDFSWVKLVLTTNNGKLLDDNVYWLNQKEWDGKVADSEQYIELEDETINQDYADFFGVEVLNGSMLDEKDGKDMVVINEAAMKAFGWTQPIGKKMGKLGKQCIVKGVIKNISYNAPIHPVAPAMFHLPDSRDRGGIIFKVKEGTWNIVSEKIKAEVNKVNPNAELMLSNIEEVYDAYMKSERTLCKLLSVVSAICILIAVFGIFSLVTLSCQQRRKEIAIRKVNGANIGIILNLFFKEYLFLLVLSSFFAFPLGYAMMKHWLENYIKQTPMEWWLYAVIFIGMGLVIFLSIIWRVWKAAQQNPAEVLKSE